MRNAHLPPPAAARWAKRRTYMDAAAEVRAPLPGAVDILRRGRAAASAHAPATDLMFGRRRTRRLRELLGHREAEPLHGQLGSRLQRLERVGAGVEHGGEVVVVRDGCRPAE
jgi:hypothetical protein